MIKGRLPVIYGLFGFILPHIAELPTSSVLNPISNEFKTFVMVALAGFEIPVTSLPHSPKAMFARTKSVQLQKDRPPHKLFRSLLPYGAFCRDI